MTFPQAMLRLAPLLIAFLGCASQSSLPTVGRSAPEKFVVRHSQYAFTTDFEIGKDDALVEDLVGLRDAVLRRFSFPPVQN